MHKTTATAHANIALIKYWGKRDPALNLPAVGSISLTLAALRTVTSVEFRSDRKHDRLLLNGSEATGKPLQRAAAFLDIFRKMAGTTLAAEVITDNNFPTGAGLASSASGFAALTAAAAGAAGLDLPLSKLSELARIGSGSAARSLYGGFVEMHLGSARDGSDAYATPIEPAAYWPLELLIVVTDESEKKIGSTEGMNLTSDTSPYYDAWVSSSPDDLKQMRKAITDQDFQRLGQLSEFSCLKMHGLAMSADPGILYWNPLSVQLIHAVRQLRAEGLRCYFTMDAGPQVKIICHPEDTEAVQEAIAMTPGISRIIRTGLGPGVSTH